MPAPKVVWRYEFTDTAVWPAKRELGWTACVRSDGLWSIEMVEDKQSKVYSRDEDGTWRRAAPTKGLIPASSFVSQKLDRAYSEYQKYIATIILEE